MATDASGYYRPVAVDSVVVMLGRTTTLGDVMLPPQAYQLGEIVVTAEQALVNVPSAATATNLPSEQAPAKLRR